MKKLKCQDCGTTEDVRVDVDPIAIECYDEVVEITVCDQCWVERCAELYEDDYNVEPPGPTKH